MTKRIGYGSQLQLGDSQSPEGFVAIPGLKDFDFPLLDSVEDVEVTTHDSPDGAKEYLPGLKDTGEFDVEIVWDAEDEVHLELEDTAEAREIRNFRAVNPIGTTYEFPAYISKLNIACPVADALTASMTLRLTAAPRKMVA